MPYVVMAYVVMAYVVMAMACIVMAASRSPLRHAQITSSGKVVMAYVVMTPRDCPLRACAAGHAVPGRHRI